jgi:Holliday junction resolvasome RuvABC DNA-binding subunit
MSKKAPLDMSSLLATKGQGAPANDAPTRPIITETHKDETTNRRSDEHKTPSSEFVNLGFKVPKEFRHRLRKMAAEKDINLVDLLREAIDLYEKANSVHQ